MRTLAALLLVLGAGCGGQDRQGLTADSAVLPPAASGADTAEGDTTGMPDSTTGDSISADSTTVSNPTFVLVADSVAGDVLFRRKGKCLSCHGLSGKGIEALGPNLQDTVWLHGDGSFAFIQRIINEGVARPVVSQIGMPSFARPANADASALSNTLSPEEIYHISAYVYSLSHAGRTVADTAQLSTDTARVGGDTLPPPIPPPAPRSAGTVVPQADIPPRR